MFELSNSNLVHAASVFVLEDATTLPPLAFKECLKVLSDTEKQRITKMRSPKRRQQYAISRFLLMNIVAQELDIQVTLDTSSTGQPFIMGWPAFCSITHSGKSIAVAFSTYGAIGIDIEKHQQRRFDKLVRHYFHKDEIDDFNSLSEDQQLPWFYRQWTIKEAMLKATGEGISFYSLSRKMNTIGNNIFTLFKNGHDYSLACAHHSNQPLQLTNITFLNNSPWIDISPI